LEGSWLLALSYESSIPQLIVFNTLLPQHDPRSWRILDLPFLARRTDDYMILVQHDALEECPEFSVDPTQKILVVFSRQRRQAFVTPVEPIIQDMCSMYTDPCVPWDGWKGRVITVQLHPDTWYLQLFDKKLVTLCDLTHHLQGWGAEVHVYDLSKSGQRDTRVSQPIEGEDGGYSRRVLSAPKWIAQWNIGDEAPIRATLIGNKLFCIFVSPLHVRKRLYYV